MKRIFRLLSCCFLGTVLFLACQNKSKEEVAVWITQTDGTMLFQKQAKTISFQTGTVENRVITLEEDSIYQDIDGYGYTLTGGSAQHLMNMSTDARAALLSELFDTTENNIGISYLRLSIGASDLNEYVFSYNDLPKGEEDVEMKQFDLGPDRKDVIPVVKAILKINPSIKLLGSPWSPPAWMKTNGDTRGGSLKPEYYQAYANYFVKYIQQMKEEGIDIDAVTVQNEPLHPGNNPSLLMLPEQQRDFVRDHLGPAFSRASLQTKIIIYDHNADRPDYPIQILNDPEAKKYIDGSAFHLYGGEIEALSEVHEAHPDKNIYFTEQWVGAPGDFSKDIPHHIKNLVIGASRNWSRNVLEWNLANGPDNRPYTDRGGCDRCLGAITIDGDEVTRNPAYYTLAHAAKFVRPGSKRIGSNEVAGLPNVAFVNPKGEKVLIVFNENDEDQSFTIRNGERSFVADLKAGAVASYVWL